MKTARNVVVLVGSLRQGSFSLKVANALAGLAPDTLRLRQVAIGQLPLFNQDEEGKPPPVVVEFKRELQSADAFLFVTPEYNRSVPGVLKNAIDVGSRPYGQSAWAGRPGAIVSISPGAIGGFGANHHLRQMLTFLDVPALAQPEAYVGNANELFDEAGVLRSESTEQFLTQFMQAFSAWIDRHGKPVAPRQESARPSLS